MGISLGQRQLVTAKRLDIAAQGSREPWDSENPHNLDKPCKGFTKCLSAIHGGHRFQHAISGIAAGIHPETIHGDDVRPGLQYSS